MPIAAQSDLHSQTLINDILDLPTIEARRLETYLPASHLQTFWDGIISATQRQLIEGTNFLTGICTDEIIICQAWIYSFSSMIKSTKLFQVAELNAQ